MQSTLRAELLAGRNDAPREEAASIGDDRSGSSRFSARDFMWLLGSVAQLKRIPFDPQLLGRQFPPPYTREKLLSTLDALGFRAGERPLESIQEGITPFPCLAFRIEPQAGSNTLIPAIVANCNAERVLYFEPSGNEPKAVPREEFLRTFEPILLLIRHEAAQAGDSDATGGAYGDSGTGRAFGFRWFIPELLKHKRIWRDVLFASLAIQVVALATPIFTQIVIDKVVVHHTQSTLWVIGIAARRG